MANQGSPYPQIEDAKVKNQRLALTVTLVGSTTTTGVVGASSCGAAVPVYCESQSLTAPSDANFASLVASPTAVVGVYLQDWLLGAVLGSGAGTGTVTGRIVKVNAVTVDANTGIDSPSMTAGVVTLKGAALANGTGKSGVTSNGNIAFQVSCTALNLKVANTTHSFNVLVDYSTL